MVSLEDIAKKVVLAYGKKIEYAHIWEVMHDEGLRDESGDLADRVWDMVQSAEVRVKIRSY